ncbi:MAG: hypothetical protein H8E73_01455, partial [Planctomycetes bacterium]|nr:hypothetical protein [Planctomycetota bacterium]
MKRFMILLFTILMAGVLSCAVSEKRKTKDPQSPVGVDTETREVLRKINSVNAYQVPDLELREDESYAKPTGDFEPFRHVRPYKEHFLLQMEYTGPGRAIPE